MVDKSQLLSSTQLPPTAATVTASKIWASQNQYFSVPHSQQTEKSNTDVPTHFILANEPRLKDQTTSKSQERQMQNAAGKAVLMPQILQHSNTQGALDPQFQMQGTSILRQKSLKNTGKRLKPLGSVEPSIRPYADETNNTNADESKLNNNQTNSVDDRIPDIFETDESKGRFDITENTQMSFKSKGYYSLMPRDSRNLQQPPFSRSIKDRHNFNNKKNVPINLANMKPKLHHNQQLLPMTTGQSLGIKKNQDLTQIIGFRKDIVQTPVQNRPRTFGTHKRIGQNNQKQIMRNVYENGKDKLESLSPNHNIHINSELRKSSQEQVNSTFGGGSVHSIYADSIHGQSKNKQLSQVEEQQSSMERIIIPDPSQQQHLVVNINTTNINTTNYMNQGSGRLQYPNQQQTFTPSTRTIPVRDKRQSIDQIQQYKGFEQNVGRHPAERYHDAKQASAMHRDSVDYRDPATIAAMQTNPNQPPAIMTYHTTSNSSLQQSIDDLYKNIEYIYKNKSRLNRQIFQGRTSKDNVNLRDRGSITKYDEIRNRDSFGFFNTSELNYADKNYRNYIKAKSRSQKQAQQFMLPKKDSHKKQMKKFIDYEREAEIDTILSKIKNGNQGASSPRHQQREESRDIDQIESVYDNLSNLISELQYFDENLKLKLHLNLELNQQDFKVWKKHASMLDMEDGSQLAIDNENNLDHLISVMRNVIENLFNHNLYSPEKYDPITQGEELKSLINQDLRTINDCIRSLMQRNSITWQMLHQMKNQNDDSHQDSLGASKILKDDRQLYENLKQNQILELCTIFMSILINNLMDQQNYYQARQKESLNMTVSNIRAEITKKLTDAQAQHMDDTKDLRKQLAEMTIQHDIQKKEKDRLFEVVREMENDIKILLEGGRNFFQIRDLMAELRKDLNQLDESANHNNKTSQIVRGILEEMEQLELEHLKMKKNRNKRRQSKHGDGREAEGDEDDDDGFAQGGAAKKKKGSARETSNQSPEIYGEIDNSDLSIDDGLDNPFEGIDAALLAKMVDKNIDGPEGQLSPKKKEDLKKRQDRKKYLLEEASKFMNKRELELFRSRILEPKPKEKKERDDQANAFVQTKLCMSKEPFSNALWRMDNPQLAEKRDREKYEVIVQRQSPVMHDHSSDRHHHQGHHNQSNERSAHGQSHVRNRSRERVKHNRSALSSKIEEDESSDMSTKKDIKNFKSLIGKLNVKQIMRPLPDHAIFRLVDVSILEMVQFDVTFYTKGVFAGASLRNPPKEQQNFTEHLQKFLMTQYGLPVMAVGYYEQIQKRILQLSTQDPPMENCMFLAKLLNLKNEAQESSIEIVESSLDKNLQSDYWMPLTQRVAIFAKLIFEDAQENGQLQQYSRFAPRAGLASKIVDQIGNSLKGKAQDNKKVMQVNIPRPDHFFGEDEVSIFELNENMGKFFPASRITLRMIEYLKPAQFDQFADDSMDLELEMMNLKFAKMKITSKLAMMNFDYKTFFEKLDDKMSDRILLYKLFSKLAENLSVYFSVNEQIAIRNALFPTAKEENVQDSRTREVILGMEKAGLHPQNKDAKKSPQKDRGGKKSTVKSFFEVMVFSLAEFQVNIKDYMVSKWDFVDFVMAQWQEYMNNLSQQVEQSFKQYDSLHNRNALNFEQFLRLLTFDLRLQFKQCFGVNESIKSLEEFYQNIIMFYEQNEGYRQLDMVGLDTIKYVVLQKNNDNIPFFKFITNKFQNLSQSQKKNMTQKITAKPSQQQNNNTQKMLRQMHSLMKQQVASALTGTDRGSVQAQRPTGAANSNQQKSNAFLSSLLQGDGSNVNVQGVQMAD